MLTAQEALARMRRIVIHNHLVGDAKSPKGEYSSVKGQKRLMAESMGHTYIPPTKIDLTSKKDYGADPLGNGMFKMVPSGDIVDYEERMRRLPWRK